MGRSILLDQFQFKIELIGPALIQAEEGAFLPPHLAQISVCLYFIACLVDHLILGDHTLLCIIDPVIGCSELGNLFRETFQGFELSAAEDVLLLALDNDPIGDRKESIFPMEGVDPQRFLLFGLATCQNQEKNEGQGQFLNLLIFSYLSQSQYWTL